MATKKDEQQTQGEVDPGSLEGTRRFWSERYGRELTLEEAREIRESCVGLARLLLEWEAKKRPED